MTDPQRFSQTHSELFGLFKAELARSGAMTGLVASDRALWPSFATFYRGLARLPRRARRALQKRWRRSLAGIALLCALGYMPAAPAAQIDVGVGGCTLVDAITAANADQVAGGCPAGSGADTISLLPGSIQTLTSENNYSGGYNGVPVITSAIVIQGNGSTIRRASSAPQFRIVAVDPNGDLTLTGYHAERRGGGWRRCQAWRRRFQRGCLHPNQQHRVGQFRGYLRWRPVQHRHADFDEQHGRGQFRRLFRRRRAQLRRPVPHQQHHIGKFRALR